MLAAFLLLRREMLDELGGFDEGFRLYGEDIDLCYRAAKAGWERWYVPQAVVSHVHAAVTDRRFLTRQDALALARDPALRAQAPRAAEGAVTSASVSDRQIIDVERLVDRAEGARRARAGAGAYADDLSGVELEVPPPTGDGLAAGFDLQPGQPRVRFRPELGFSSKPVIGPVITGVKKFDPPAHLLRLGRPRPADGRRGDALESRARRRGGHARTPRPARQPSALERRSRGRGSGSRRSPGGRPVALPAPDGDRHAARAACSSSRGSRASSGQRTTRSAARQS